MRYALVWGPGADKYPWVGYHKGIRASPVQLILEGLGVLVNTISLGKKSSLSCSTAPQDFELSSNVLLQIHGPGNTVLGEHGSRGFLDVLQLSSGSVLPSVNCLQGVVKVNEGSAEIFNNGNGVLEASDNLELGINGLDLLVENLLLVFGEGDGHASEVSLMLLKSPLIVLLLLLYRSCLFFRSERASSRLYLFLTILISSSATSN